MFALLTYYLKTPKIPNRVPGFTLSDRIYYLCHTVTELLKFQPTDLREECWHTVTELFLEVGHHSYAYSAVL